MLDITPYINFYTLFTLLSAFCLIKLIDFLLVQPLKFKSLYQKQGVNVKCWHPFHTISRIRYGVKNNDFLLGFKELFQEDPDTKAYFFYWGIVPTLILNRTEQIKDFTMTKESKFQRNPNRSKSVELSVGRHNLIHGDYAQWKASRQLFLNFFSFQNIKTMVPEIITLSRKNLQPFLNQEQKPSTFNLIDVFGMITGQVIFSLFCGTNQDALYDQNGVHLCLKLQDAVGKFNESVRFGISFMFPSIGNFLKRVGLFERDRILMRDMNYVKQKVEEQLIKTISSLGKEDSQANKFMIQARPQLEELMKDKVKMVSEFMVLFNAGTDTTSHVIQQILMNLHSYPEVRRKVMEEIDEHIKDGWNFSYEDVSKLKYMECVIKESLRLSFPAPGINPRQLKNADENIVLDDIFVKKGTQICLVFMTTLLNKKYFPQPFLFQPERWLSEDEKINNPFVFTPFSMGTRSCIGERMSLLEQKVIIAIFLKNFNFTIDTDISKIVWIMRTVYQPRDPVRITVTPKPQS